jgi:hypothetical protein
MKDQSIRRSLTSSNRYEPAAAKTTQQIRAEIWRRTQCRQTGIDNYRDSSSRRNSSPLGWHANSCPKQDDCGKHDRQQNSGETFVAVGPARHGVFSLAQLGLGIRERGLSGAAQSSSILFPRQEGLSLTINQFG